MRGYTLITGATSGIGLETSRKLAVQNRLLVVGRDQDKLDDLARELGKEHLSLRLDLASVESIEARLRACIRESGVGVNKVIHCAGIDHAIPVKSLTADHLDTVMRVNFYSAVEIIRVLMKRSINPAALENILFVSSVSSIRGFKSKAAYSASKAALDGYMRVLSKELAPSASVNSILPGAVPTKLSEFAFASDDQIAKIAACYPLGIGSVNQVVDAIQNYHDSANSWITGQQIVVDGGLTS